MVNFRVSHLEFQTEEKMGVKKDQGKYYQVDIEGVRKIATLRMGVKI